MDGPASELAGIGTGDELITRWEALTGRRVRHLEWYDVFTLVRLGAVMIRLFANMAAAGQIPEPLAIEQGRDSAPMTALAARLDELA